MTARRPSSRPAPEAVLFDLDGTLLDTIEDLADSMNAVLARQGLPPHGVEAYKRFVGDGVEMLVRRALPEDRRDEGSVAGAVEAMVAVYGGRWDEKSRPYPGIPEMLDGLVARGLSLAVLSNKPHDFTLLCVEKLLPDWTFDEVVGAKPGVPRKPDPTAALAIAERLEVPPDRFLYLGDTNTDVRTAAAAGMIPVGALWGFRGEAELRDAGAEILIEAPEELLQHVVRRRA